MTKVQFTNKEHYRWDLWEAGEGMMGTCFAHGYLDPRIGINAIRGELGLAPETLS